MSADARSQKKVVLELTRMQAMQLASAADRMVRTLPNGPERKALDNAYEAIEAALRAPPRMCDASLLQARSVTACTLEHKHRGSHCGVTIAGMIKWK